MTLRFHGLTILWASFILFLGVLPASMFPQHEFLGQVSLDKIVHFILYFFLTLFCLVGFKKQYFNRRISFQPITLAVVLTVAFGCAIEILQQFVSSRSFEWLDILANNAGVLLGLGAFRWIYGKRLFYA